MIKQTLRQVRSAKLFEVEHLPFRFTTTIRTARRASPAKVLELLRVVAKLLLLRRQGPIDCMLFPIGGPQFVPIMRDILLFPLILLLTRNVILHFHAGGTAETIDQLPRLVSVIAKFLYRRVSAAIVMTHFGRRDPESLGIRQIAVVPHNFEDTFDTTLLRRGEGQTPRLLYVGHLCPEKGTVALLGAVHSLRARGIAVRLDLVGECLPPYTQPDLTAMIDRLALHEITTVHGVQAGLEKWQRYGEADLFVFPSLAYESFGVVMVEAMMWSLPVLACEWRGNREVLGNPAAELLFSPTPNLADQLSDALERVFAHRPQWDEWGRRNRELFLKRYSAALHSNRLARVICDILEAKNRAR